MPSGISDRDARIWCLDLYFTSSFPVSYDRTFDAAPFRISSIDVTPDYTALGSNLYEGRLLEAPTVVSQVLDDFGGARAGETLRFRIRAEPQTFTGVILHSLVASGIRGKRVDGWFLDLDPDTFQPAGASQVFAGEILSAADDPDSLDILVRVFDPWSMTDLVPLGRVEPSWAPYAPAAGQGQIVPHGIGIGRRIRCPPVKARSADDTILQYTVVANTSTDALDAGVLVDWLTGDGPIKLSTSGTLPAPLQVGVDYFVVMVSDTAFQVASTRGAALAGFVFDLTTVGTGTHVATFGQLPNQDDHTDFVVGFGNVTVNQIWLDGETESPELPLDYDVLTQEYRVAGRYVTIVRLPGDWSESTLEADVLRVDYDVDGSMILDAKFSRGFQDDARGIPITPTNATTNNLVQGFHGFGFGAMRFAVADNVTLNLPVALQQYPNRTIRLVWTVPFYAPGGGSFLLLYWDGAISLTWETPGEYLQLITRWKFQAGDPASGETLTTFNGEVICQRVATTAGGTVEQGKTYDIIIVSDSGTISLYIDGSALEQHTKNSAQNYVIPQPVIGASGNPIAGVLHRVQAQGRALSQRQILDQIRVWQRNGIAFMREMLTECRWRVDQNSFDQAEDAWQTIESGALVVDGWMQAETELRSVVLELARMRAVRLGRSIFTQLITADLPAVSPPITAQLGFGDELNNLVDKPVRVQASATEAPSQLVCRFRRQRSQQSVEFAMQVTRPLFATDTPPRFVDLPFVDGPVPADITCDWMAQRLRLHDHSIQVAAGRAARDHELGERVALTVPGMNITWDTESIGLERGVHRQGLSLVRWNITPYQQQELPADPLPPIFLPVDIGNAPQFNVKWADFTVSTSPIHIEVTPASFVGSQRPISDAGFSTLSSFPVTFLTMSGIWNGLYAEMDDPGSHDGDATAVRINRGFVDGNSSVAVVWCNFPPVDPNLAAFSVSIAWDAKAGAVNEVIEGSGIGAKVDPTLTQPPQTLTGGAGYVSGSDVMAPLDGGPWTGAKLNASALGFKVTVKQNVYVTRLRRSFFYRTSVPDGVIIRYWHVGPSITTPATPPETAGWFAETWDFAPVILPQENVSSGTWWFWARVYDRLGRMLALLGPVSIAVP